MKKLVASIILGILVLNAFLPAIYATENSIVNELQNERAEESIEEAESEETEIEELETEETTIEDNFDELENEELPTVEIENTVQEELKAENLNIEEHTVQRTLIDERSVSESYTGRMYIEEPSNNQTMTLPNNNTIKVSGWAVSNDSQATLKVYINNQYIKNATTRISRPDVDYLVSPEYGGTASTPKAGFEVDLDISGYAEGNYTIKVEEVSRYGVVICKEERTVRIAQIQYTGKMYIEMPSNNQTMTLPNNNTIKVSGWAVSNDSQATLKVYINNQYIKNATTRISRPDVDYLVSPEYGGTASTPKAGFEVDLDISGYAEGNYTIKVEEVSRYGVVICKEERTVRIAQIQYTGKMYIEMPSNNQTMTLPNNNTIKVSGWAVSNDSEATLKVYINNQYIKNATTRISRPDVDYLVSPEYGGTASTPKAGFEVELDISGYAEGNYTIKVEEVSRYGVVICKEERTVRIAQIQYTGKMYIEMPSNNQTMTLPNNNTIKVSGWAVSNDNEATLKVYINNQYIKNATTRISRPDVDYLVSPEYGGTASTPKAGFEVDLDISGYAEGNYTIKVEEVSRYGVVICKEERTVRIAQIQYTGRMYIESPTVLTHSLPDQNVMNITGWAVSNDIGAYMIVVIDGRMYPCTVSRNNRADVDQLVSPEYGGIANTPKAGISINVNIDDLQDGSHTVIVSEVSRFHKIVASSQIQLNTTSPNYTGLMNIENPIQNKRYPSDWLQVTGWAMTECSGDFMKIYLDGQYQTIAEATKRPDVLSVHSSKYPNHNEYAGFVSNICTMGLGEGMHKITVQQCSRYGKVIQEKEVSFMISNTTTWGVDVSHHNETINWDAVRNSGVNFAILKIGEYRESTGAVFVDSKFEENYAACKARGIAVGGYFYSYAFNPTEAAHEADACTRIISGKSFEMPIFIDIEDSIVTNAVNSGRTNVENLTNAMITFCDIMNSRGYQAGVYSYKNFFEEYLNTSVLERYNIWLAHYVSDTNYAGKYDIWQYTSSGIISGINGFVDLNWAYKRY